MTATVFEAKTNLSELIQRAREGEEIIITSGREKTPVVRVVPIEEFQPKRLGVCYDSNFELGESFWEPLPPGWSGNDSSDSAL